MGGYPHSRSLPSLLVILGLLHGWRVEGKARECLFVLIGLWWCCCCELGTSVEVDVRGGHGYWCFSIVFIVGLEPKNKLSTRRRRRTRLSWGMGSARLAFAGA